MIVGTFKTFEVGKIVKLPHFVDAEGNSHYQVPAKIMRAASLEEYIEYCKEHVPDVNSQGNLHFEPNAKFYEISVD